MTKRHANDLGIVVIWTVFMRCNSNSLGFIVENVHLTNKKLVDMCLVS